MLLLVPSTHLATPLSIQPFFIPPLSTAPPANAKDELHSTYRRYQSHVLLSFLHPLISPNIFLLHSDIVPANRSEYTHTLLTDYTNLDQYIAQSSVGNLPESSNGPDSVQWESIKTRPLSLSTLEALMKANNPKTAILLLQRKLRLDIPNSYFLPLTDTVFGMSYTLDYLCITPKLPGFSVILPPDDYVASNSWEFNLELMRPLKPLKVKVCTSASRIPFVHSSFSPSLAWRSRLRSRGRHHVYRHNAWLGYLDRHGRSGPPRPRR